MFRKTNCSETSHNILGAQPRKSSLLVKLQDLRLKLAEFSRVGISPNKGTAMDAFLQTFRILSDQFFESFSTIHSVNE